MGAKQGGLLRGLHTGSCDTAGLPVLLGLMGLWTGSEIPPCPRGRFLGIQPPMVGAPRGKGQVVSFPISRNVLSQGDRSLSRWEAQSYGRVEEAALSYCHSPLLTQLRGPPTPDQGS